MLAADCVHEDIRVDKNHVSVFPRPRDASITR
jgi:hypothetical protein